MVSERPLAHRGNLFKIVRKAFIFFLVLLPFSIYAISSMVNFHLFTPAHMIAIDNLRSNYLEGVGIQTGGTHYLNQIWLRDQAFASFGSCVLGDYSIVKAAIRTCVKHQDEEGNFPVSLGVLSEITEPLEWGRLARTDRAMDVPSNFVMMVCNLYNYTRDTGLFENIPACQKAINCLTNKTVDGLIRQEGGQDWMDKWRRSGAVTYTNILYYKALKDLAFLERQAGENTAATNHETLAMNLNASINGLLWDQTRGYYNETLMSGDYDIAANLLAIIYDIASPEKAQRIISNLHYSIPVTPSLNDGLDGWICVASLEIIARWKLVDISGAQRLADNISKVIVENGNVPEYLYGYEGKMHPISEYNYAWNAGMFIYALNITGIEDRTESAPFNPSAVGSVPFLVVLIPAILLLTFGCLLKFTLKKSIIELLKSEVLMVAGLFLFFLCAFFFWKIYWIEVFIASKISEIAAPQGSSSLGIIILFLLISFLTLFALLLGLSLATYHDQARITHKSFIKQIIKSGIIALVLTILTPLILYFWLFFI